MKITNTAGLPAPLVNAVTFSERKRGDADYTVTELLRPPRIAALEELHKDEIEEDVSERIWALMGSAGHEVLRRSAAGGIVEERADIEIGGFKISGQMDYAINEKAIWDYKFCSIYQEKDGARPEWIAQLNCYRYIASKYGVPIEKLYIVMLFRDWCKRESQQNSSYPQTQVKGIEIPIWTDDTVENWILRRISSHEAAKKQLPECTDEEVWARPEKWAVKKKGAVRAIKLHDSEEVARQHAAAMIGLLVEHRPGERPRCESYCRVSAWCTQYQDWLKKNAPPAAATPRASPATVDGKNLHWTAGVRQPAAPEAPKPTSLQ